MAKVKRIRPAQWYEPTDPELSNPVSGTYEVLATGQAEACLHSPWSERLERLHGIGDALTPRVLHGYVYNEDITLVAPRIHAGSLNFSTLNETVLQPSYALEGAFGLAEDELFATEICLKLWDQDAWTKWSSWEILNESKPKYSTIERRIPESLQARVPGGVVILEDLSWGNQNNPLEIVLQSQSMFRLKFDRPVPIDEIFEKWIVPLELLIITSTGRYSGIESMSIKNNEWVVDGLRHDSERWLRLRRRFARRPDAPLPDLGRLHALSDLEFERCIPLLFSAAEKLRFPADLYLSLLSNNLPGFLIRCTTATQMVESLHRALYAAPAASSIDENLETLVSAVKDALYGIPGVNSATRRSILGHLRRRNEPTLASRLKELDRDAGYPVSTIIEDPDWANQIADVRNIVTHGLEHSVRLATDLTATRVVNLICQRLFETHWLMSIGFSAEEARQRVDAKDVTGSARRYIADHNSAMVNFREANPV